LFFFSDRAMTNLGTIVFVGTDVCARTNVLASAGYTLRECECEVNELREALLQGPADAVLFQCIPEPPSRLILTTARALTAAPLVLFADQSSAYDPEDFNVVLAGLCSPLEWLPPITKAIASHRNLDQPKPPRSEVIETSSKPLDATQPKKKL
jgi:hypothetical protein